jgi:FkbM family methyltransferase
VTLVDLSRRVRRLRVLQRQQWLWRIARLPYHGVLRALSRVHGIGRVIGSETYRWRYPFSEYDTAFEGPVLEAFREILRPGMTVLDIGANFGLYSVIAGRQVGEAGKVVAFEPSRVVAVLADHLSLNGLTDRVEVVPLIVTDEVGEAIIWEPEDAALASLSRAAAERGGGTQNGLTHQLRSATTIDIFCGTRNLIPDILKIDVEGAEGKVLRGARSFLENRRGQIILEVHPRTLRDFGDTQESLLAYLRSLGWDASELFARGAPEDPAATVHYLCSPTAQPVT